MENKTIIIAEAGVNHNGDINLAKRLVEVAASAGADYVKFQTFTADRQVTQIAPKAPYQTLATGGVETQYQMLRQLELTERMHHDLIDYCAACNIGFLSSAFDIQSINLLSSLGQDYFKIPSGEITNLPYLRSIGQLQKNIILSTGMANMEEIQSAIQVLEVEGVSRSMITVLHCTTEYPTPMSDVNLRAMKTIKSAFGVKVGYSDHTQGIEVPIAAVAMGATIIEKHFTLDRNMPGPDHTASIEPSELAQMVRAVRNIEVALGDGIKKPSENEKKNIFSVRKSIVASRIINLGEKYSHENLAVKRPANGISPMLWDEVIGKCASKKYLPDEPIEL